MGSTIVTRTLWKYLRLMFTFGNTFHTHPFQWNEGLKKGQLCTSKWQLAVWYLNVGLTAVYSTYLVGRGLQISLSEESSNTKKVYIKFILFYYAFPTLFQMVNLLKKEELTPFYQLNVTAIRVFQEHISDHEAEEGQKQAAEVAEDHRPLPRPSLVPKMVDRFFDFVWYGFLGIICCIGLLNCARPKSPEFISSFLAPASGIFRWLVIILSAIFQMYYAYAYMANAFFYIYLGFGVGIPAVVALIQTKGWFQTASSRIPQARVQRILAMYRSVEIIVRAFESALCDIMVPVAKGILVSLCVFCSYGAIRMEGFLAVFLGAVGVLASGVLIPMLSAIAMLNTVSGEILRLMRQPRFQDSLTPVQKKEGKSLHVIQLRMRRGYILDKECVKTVYQIIVDSTVDMLLAQA